MKRKKVTGKVLKKSAGKARKAAKKAVKSGSKTLQKNLRQGAAVVRKKVREATPVVEKAVRSGVAKMAHLTGEAAKLAKLKFEMAALNLERDRLAKDLGGQVWDLYQQERLDAVKENLAESFQKMEDLSRRMAEKEAEIKAVDLT